MTTPHPELIDVFTTVTGYDCGCLVGITYTGKSTPNLVTEVMRCPLHEAARVMLAALRGLVEMDDNDRGPYADETLVFQNMRETAWPAARAAIAAATSVAEGPKG